MPSVRQSQSWSPTGLWVIIVNWNTRDLLAECLESIERPARDGICEVLVIDNGSSDGSTAMVGERFPWVRLIENEENVGFAAASNQAIRQAMGRYALLLNSDAFLPAGALPRLLQFADDHPGAGIVGVRLVNPDGTFQAALNDFPSLGTLCLEAWGLAPKLSGNPYHPSYPPEKSRQAMPCDWVGGACLLARAEAIEQVGVLDESFFMYSEEMDWCYRMWQAGWEVWYTPEVEVIHHGGASADRMTATQRIHLYASKARFVAKHQSPISAFLVRLNYRCASFMKAIGYHVRFLMAGGEDVRQRARSHWEVATARSWS